MHIKTKDLLVNFICILFAGICVFFHQYSFASWISLVIFVLYCVYLLKQNVFFYIKYFPLVFSSISLILGTLFCEFTSIDLYEIAEKAHFVGSVPALILFQIVLYAGISLFDKPIKKNEISVIVNNLTGDKYPSICHMISIGSTILLFLLFVRIIRTPAFLAGYDRFQYAEMVYSNTGIWRLIDNFSYALIVFPALDFVNHHKISGGCGLLVYMLYNLWNGNKFGPFLTVLIFFLLVDYEKIALKNKARIRKLIRNGILCIVGLLLVASVLATNVMHISIEQYFGSRLAQQGQLWWKTYEVSDTSHMSEITDEIHGTFYGSSNVSDNVGASHGIYKIMYLCGSKPYIDNKLRAGSRFTEAGYASAYYYLGTVGGVLFSLLFALIFAKTLNGFIRAIKNWNWINIAVLTRLYTIERITFSMFLFDGYFDSISILSYLLLITTSILYCGRKRVR